MHRKIPERMWRETNTHVQILLSQLKRFLGFTETQAGAHICSQEKAKKNSLLQHRDQIPTATAE
jgi:hypothetical protein